MYRSNAVDIVRITMHLIPALVLGAGYQAAEGQFLEPGTVVIHEFTGEAAGDKFGWVSEDIGDITGDAVHDLVITAPANDTGGSNRGRAYVYNGATGALVFPPITGLVNNARFGDSVGAPGDVNNDTVGDIVVGSPQFQSSRGRVAVHSGVDGSEIHFVIGAALGDSFGYDVSGAGDINGDGFMDYLVGAPGHDSGGNNAGRAYVYSGANASLICTIDGESAADRFGSCVHWTSDVDGDDIPDPIVGAETYGPGAGSGTGRAYVYSGADCLQQNDPPPIRVLTPFLPVSLFGQWFCDGNGDVDNDGTPDVYVSDYNANRARVFSGASGALIRTYSGDNNGGFGIGRFAGDVDQDGWTDLILAAWVSPAGGMQAGKGFVYSGRTSLVLQTYTHTVPFAQLGFDANAMGDVNGDDRVDYLLTAANDSSGTGKAYLVAGNIDPYPRADINLDRDVDDTDVFFFTLAVLGSPLPLDFAKRSDFNDDNLVNGTDIQRFVNAFLE